MKPTAVTAARRRALRSMLSRRRITNQQQLVDLLGSRGYTVTQATVSRDLDAIGAIKNTDARGSRYAIPEATGDDEAVAALGRLLAEFVEEITASGNLVVLKTPPGAAQVVASALDGARLPEVVGTVAGDDTLLAVAVEKTGGRQLAKRLEQIGAGK